MIKGRHGIEALPGLFSVLGIGLIASEKSDKTRRFILGNIGKNKKISPDETRLTRLGLLMKNLPGVAYLARNDDAYTMLYLSGGIKDLTGYDAKQFLDRQIAYADLIYEADRKKVKSVMDNIIRKNTRLCLEYRIVTKEGQIKWVFEQGSPDHHESHKEGLICGMILDITTRKKMEEALMIERQRLARVVEGAPDIIFEIDTHKTFVNIYGHGLEKLGMRPEDIIGKTLKEVFTQSYEQRDIYYEKALSGQNVHYNWVYNAVDPEMHFHSSIGPLYDRSGNVIGAVGIAREITQERKAAIKHEHLSHHDSLTDLYNRHYLYEVMEREVHRAERYEEHLSLIVLDIDDFKKINDTFGHLTGDRALIDLARKLEAAVRKSDMVFRIGGEEFLIVLPQTDLRASMNLAERIRALIETADDSEYGRLTCSFGVAERKQDEPLESWWKRADDAMYEAKAQGKDTVRKAE